MLQVHSNLRTFLRKYVVASVLATAALLLVGNAVGAENVKNDRATRLLVTVRVTPTGTNTTAGALYSFDISWVDQPNRLYFLADRSNKVVDVVDTTANILVAQLATASRRWDNAFL